jgi:hypothetical protein
MSFEIIRCPQPKRALKESEGVKHIRDRALSPNAATQPYSKAALHADRQMKPSQIQKKTALFIKPTREDESQSSIAHGIAEEGNAFNQSRGNSQKVNCPKTIEKVKYTRQE